MRLVLLLCLVYDERAVVCSGGLLGVCVCVGLSLLQLLVSAAACFEAAGGHRAHETYRSRQQLSTDRKMAT